MVWNDDYPSMLSQMAVAREVDPVRVGWPKNAARWEFCTTRECDARDAS